MTNARTTVQVSAYQIIYIKLNQTILTQTTTAHKRIEKQSRQQNRQTVDIHCGPKMSPFLLRVSTLTRDIHIAILSQTVCLSVRPSVTFRYQMKTA